MIVATTLLMVPSLEDSNDHRGMLTFASVELIARHASVKIPSSVTEISDFKYNKEAIQDPQNECFSWYESFEQAIFHHGLRFLILDIKAMKSSNWNCPMLSLYRFGGSSIFFKFSINERKLKILDLTQLPLPHSIREVGMKNLKPIHDSNDLYQSIEKGSTVFSKIGIKHVYEIVSTDFEIPDRVTKKISFHFSSYI